MSCYSLKKIVCKRSTECTSRPYTECTVLAPVHLCTVFATFYVDNFANISCRPNQYTNVYVFATQCRLIWHIFCGQITYRVYRLMFVQDCCELIFDCPILYWQWIIAAANWTGTDVSSNPQSIREQQYSRILQQIRWHITMRQGWLLYTLISRLRPTAAAL